VTSFQQDLITQLVGGLVGGFVAFAAAIFVFHRERQDSLLERQEEYIVEACWDIVDRSWSATNAAEIALEADRPWDAYRAFDDLSAQMWGQGPRYRHAGIADFADSVRAAAANFLSTVFAESGGRNADRQLRELFAEQDQMSEATSDADRASIRAGLTQLDEQLKASTERQRSFLEDFRGLLRKQFESKISNYSPGQPLAEFDAAGWRSPSTPAQT
jgi:hypothetical protein